MLALLQEVAWRWLYAERMEDTRLCFLEDALNDQVPWTRWRYARAFDEDSELTWQRREVLIAPQDVLFLYTDGVIEAEENPDSAFGLSRLLDSAKKRLGGTAAEVKRGIIADVRQFVGDRPLLDDLLLFVIKRN